MNTFSNIHVEDVDLLLGRREDGQSSKHSGAVISCADTTMINSTLSGLSPSKIVSNHTMCIYPKKSDSRHGRRRYWWCYNKKKNKECYT